MTLKIAKLELNNLLYSPIAWLVLVGFSIFTAAKIVPLIEQYVISQSLYDSQAYVSITSTALNSHIGYYTLSINILMVLVPLISMGVSSGSVKLLYSSPIKLYSIVIGKYLALLFFVFLLMLVAFSGVLLIYASVEHMDFNLGVSGLFGLFLLSAAIAAISVYVSTFSSYPIVDVVVAIAIVYGLNLLYGLVKGLPVVNDIIFWVAPARHVNAALAGLITSKAVGYFAVLTGLFLLWSNYKMQLKRQTRAVKRVTRLKMALALLVAAMLIFCLARPMWLLYKDVTYSKQNSLSPTTASILAPLKDKPIKITTYVNVFTWGSTGLFPAFHIQDQLFFEKYYRLLPQIEMEYVYYYNEENKEAYQINKGDDPNEDTQTIIEKMANLYKMDIDMFHSLPDLELEGAIKNKYGKFNFRLIEGNGHRAILMYEFNGATKIPLEAQITTAFKELVSKSYGLAFVTGHEERGIGTSRPGD